MRILALDTSTFVGTVAVLRDGELLAEWSASVRVAHGETLLPHVARALELSGLALPDIELIAVGIGPGSFTGVRIGVATAKGLALALHRPLVGVSSLRVLARGLSVTQGLLVPVVDAYKNEVYCAAYQLCDGQLEERIAPFHAPPAEAAQRLSAVDPEEPRWLCGNGPVRYGAAFLSALSAPFARAPSYCDVPRASCLAHEAELGFARHGPADLAKLEPMYLRPSDAKLPSR